MSDTITIRNRGYLPHWERENGCYFITFRVADSLPSEVLRKMEFEHEHTLWTAQHLQHELNISEMRHWVLREKIEQYLDAGAGACHLPKPEIAEIAAKAIQHFDGKRYRLFAWCVMPNHVHVVLQLFPQLDLSSLLHSWKSFTAKAINKALSLQGEFWQREYYDHLIRNDRDFERVIRYVAENPATAGLRDWKWVWVDPECRRDAGATSVLT